MGTHVIELLSLFVMKQTVVFKAKVMFVPLIRRLKMKQPMSNARKMAAAIEPTMYFHSCFVP